MQNDDERPPKTKTKAPAWLLTFADLSTLLLTFLALMLSFSNMDVIEFRQMMGSIEKAFGSSRASTGFYMATTTLEESSQESQDDKESSYDEQQYDKFKTEQATKKMLEKTMGGEGMEVSGGLDGFRVKIDSSFFFGSGNGDLKKNKKVADVLRKIAILIKKKKYACIVEGYTDSVPIHTAKFPSNIHLAAARAQIVAEFLLKQGVPENLIEAHGYGSRFLIYDEEGKEIKDKSRRVEFVFTDLRDTRFDIRDRDEEEAAQ